MIKFNLKIKKFKFISGFVCGALVFGTIGAFANNGIENITAKFNPNLKITLDGEAWDLERGAINYQHTNYLSIRELAENLGKEVEWNEKTQTIEIVSPAIDTDVDTDNKNSDKTDQDNKKNNGKVDENLNENNNLLPSTNECTTVEKYGLKEVVVCGEEEYIYPRYIHDNYFESVTIYYDNEKNIVGLKDKTENVLIDSIPVVPLSNGKSAIPYSYFKDNVLPIIMRNEHTAQ